MTGLRLKPRRSLEVGSSDLVTLGSPPRPTDEVVAWRAANVPHLARGHERVVTARSNGLPHIYGLLWLSKRQRDGTIVDYGLASMRLVTNAGLTWLVQCFLGEEDILSLQYHGIGASDIPESPEDEDLVDELGQNYPIEDLRAVGSSTEVNDTTFRSVGNCQVADDVSVREHGVFTHGTVGQGVLFDRSTFTTVPLEAGEAIQMTYDLVLSAGS